MPGSRQTSEGKALPSRFPGGQAPLGYARGPSGILRAVPREAEVVRAIFREYPRRKSLGALAVWLKRRGVRNRGKGWNRQTLAWMLRNPAYVGVLRVAGRERPGGHPALVTQEAFGRVGGLLASRRRNRARGRSHEARAPFYTSAAAPAFEAR